MAFQGIEARAGRRAGADRAGPAELSSSSACPTRRWPKAASGCAPRSHASGLALPAKRITVNLAPADLPKEGSHYDLPIALGADGGDGRHPARCARRLCRCWASSRSTARSRRWPACCRRRSAPTPAAAGLICPAACGPEAAWAGADIEILAPRSLIALVNHLRAPRCSPRPQPASRRAGGRTLPDLARRQGPGERQAGARDRRRRRPQPPDDRAARRRQVDAGRSACPSILPPLTPRELLEVSMIASIAGELADGALTDRRPFRAPHHSASHGGAGRRRLARRARAKCRWPITACCSSTSCPEFTPQVLDRCASRWRPARP